MDACVGCEAQLLIWPTIVYLFSLTGGHMVGLNSATGNRERGYLTHIGGKTRIIPFRLLTGPVLFDYRGKLRVFHKCK